MCEYFYTAQHEWVRFKEGRAIIGHTGKGLSGDIVYIELPETGQHLQKGEPCASVEAVKTVVDVHAPLDGTVNRINDTVYDDPDIILRQPMETWLIEIELEEKPDLGDLLTQSEYEQI